MQPSSVSPGLALRTIETDADIADGVAALAVLDPRLKPIIDVAGHVPLRRSEGGFRGLARIIVAQQISRSAAEAIWSRFDAHLGDFRPQDVRLASEDDLRACGLSRPKIRTLKAIASACDSHFKIERLAGLPVDEAIGSLTGLYGVGPWTAEVYLLFCLGHADIFPAGDLALMVAVGDAFGFKERPDEKTLRAIAEHWAPWRGVAARLFWRYYAVTRRDATPG